MHCPVIYEDSNHTYTLKSTGKLVPGCTTITGLLHKPYLIPWASKMAVTHIRENWERMMNGEIDKVLKEAQNAHAQKSKDGRDKGTEIHDLLEKWTKAQIKGQVCDLDGYDAFGGFLRWNEERRPKWLYSEMVVGSEVHEFGGKFDAVAEIDGKIYIIDYKTSNYHSNEYHLQLAGYQIALEEMGFQATERLVLLLTKQGKFEAVPITTPLDLDRKAFLGLREVQRFEAYLKTLS